MSNSKLYPLVYEPHVKIYTSETSHFSIGTSPYYAHKIAVGLDIYEQISIQNYDVLSPVAGQVLQIKEMRAPQPKFKGGIDKEYLTVIQNRDDKHTVFKILHIKPELKVGQKVEPGDPLGTTIRNGYFAPWSSPHIHLELKKPQDVLRAKKGLSFMLNTKKEAIMNPDRETANYKQIPIKVEYVCDEFYLCRFPDDLYFHISPFYGLRGNSGNVNFIIDGGIPQYKHGIIHCNNKDHLNIQSIYFNNIKIGALNDFQERYGLITLDKVHILLNNVQIRGISLFLAKHHPLIKLIPFDKVDFALRKNSIQNLSLYV